MAEMVKLSVNGQEVEVEAGKNLIDAVGAVGIEIPIYAIILLLAQTAIVVCVW